MNDVFNLIGIDMIVLPSITGDFSTISRLTLHGAFKGFRKRCNERYDKLFESILVVSSYHFNAAGGEQRGEENKRSEM